LEDDGGFDADNTLVARKVIVGQILQVLHVPDGDVGQQIEAAGEEEDLPDFGDLIEALHERVHGVPLMAGELHVDEGLHTEAQFGEIDIRVGAAEQAGGTQLLEAFVARRGRQADGGGELFIREPRIFRQQSQQSEGSLV
jgi:hypothetical protein